MRKLFIILIAVLVMVFAISGCKKNLDVMDVKISHLMAIPGVIDDDEVSTITVQVTGNDDGLVMINAICDYGTTNPAITSVSSNPTYIEYMPPDIEKGDVLIDNVVITIISSSGESLDKATIPIKIKGN